MERHTSRPRVFTVASLPGPWMQQRLSARRPLPGPRPGRAVPHHRRHARRPDTSRKVFPSAASAWMPRSETVPSGAAWPARAVPARAGPAATQAAHHRRHRLRHRRHPHHPRHPPHRPRQVHPRSGGLDHRATKGLETGALAVEAATARGNNKRCAALY